MTNNTLITKDLPNRKLHVVRAFNAPVEKIWKAWTEKDLLDKWWAPRPWRAETKTIDFKTGGLWLYCMVSPDNAAEKHWCLVNIKTVVPQQRFTSVANFCDEDGNINPDFPNMYWAVEFKATETGTKVEVELSFDSDAGMQTIVGMGFEGGFTMALGNLDELLEI